MLPSASSPGTTSCNGVRMDQTKQRSGTWMRFPGCQLGGDCSILNPVEYVALSNVEYRRFFAVAIGGKSEC
jgi:hypothetical protein